jgi:hypothetical protein
MSRDKLKTETVQKQTQLVTPDPTSNPSSETPAGLVSVNCQKNEREAQKNEHHRKTNVEEGAGWIGDEEVRVHNRIFAVTTNAHSC